MTSSHRVQNEDATTVIAALDVGYQPAGALGAGVLFSSWDAEGTIAETTVNSPAGADYVPGEFYRRELPILLSVLSRLPQEPTCIVVDGYVWLDEAEPGLGAHLWMALAKRPVVVGVAKNPFRRAGSYAEVLRGKSSKPLFVTSTGMQLEEAAHKITSMHGSYRIPTLLRRVDALSRGLGRAPSTGTGGERDAG